MAVKEKNQQVTAKKIEQKILYFEAAGMDFYEEETYKVSDVGNFRIRTAFANDQGEQYYIELTNAAITVCTLDTSNEVTETIIYPSLFMKPVGIQKNILPIGSITRLVAALTQLKC
ncbi:hypothetical protein [Paenibacillus sp. Y412MC10]|uniref:hypothetical protein n=1 Tax=Geobacillus sp. (strain Y412MC10) TaxID=481743 RepID=UPI0011A32DC8|nr:hypothetical protein [Paenibacillus sp. Y412MC10]